MLISDVSWREMYSSAALNRKFKGVIRPGIYAGFNVVSGDGTLTVSSQGSAAIANVNSPSSKLIDGLGEYVLTIHLTKDVTLDVPIGENYLVMRVSYAIGSKTISEFLFLPEPAVNDVVLCKAVRNPVAEGEFSDVILNFDDRENSAFVSSGFVTDLINSLVDLSKDATGFTNRTDSRLIFDDATRTVTIEATNDVSFDVHYRNRRISINRSSVQVANVSGGRYININPTTGKLVEGAEFPNIEQDLLAAYIYYSVEQGKFVIKGDERHSSARDTTWHSYTHQDNGMLWRRGGGLTYLEKDDTNIGVGVGTPLLVADEDLQHTINHADVPAGAFEQVLEGTAEIPVIYVGSDGIYRQDEATGTPYKMGAARVAYNAIDASGLGEQADVESGKFVNYFVVATNCTEFPLKAIQGRQVFDSKDDAQSENIEAYGLQLAEIVALYQIVLAVDDAYTNDFKARIEAVFLPEQGKKGGIPTISALDHAGLGGRNKPDQHTIDSITNLRQTLNDFSTELDEIAESVGKPTIAKPYIVYPTVGGEDPSTTLTIVGSEFLVFNATDNFVGAIFEIRDALDQVVHTSPVTAASLSYQVPANVLERVKDYTVRVLYQGEFLGNSKWSDPVAFKTSNVAIQTPAMLAPTDGSIDIPEQPILESSVFAMTEGVGTFDGLVFRVKNSLGAIIHISPKIMDYTYSLPAGIIEEGEQEYSFDTQHYSAEGDASQWSTPVSVITADSFIPSTPGAPFGGGYFMALYTHPRFGVCALVDAGKAGDFGIGLKWKTAQTDTPNTNDDTDGEANTAAMISNSKTAHEAAAACADYRGGGHDDWCLPAKNQREITYRYGKPFTQANHTSSGANTAAIPPTTNYTASVPAQTDIDNYKQGGLDAFTETNYYWTSTQHSATNGWLQNFSSGTQNIGYKASTGSCTRAVRSVPLA